MMKKRILALVKWAEERAQSGAEITERELKYLSRNIRHFQHERLIHLIVTAFVGISDMISLLIFFLQPSYLTVALPVLLTVLFCFYIAHYYILENNTQKLYELEDKLNG